jgi:hypothetical protein
LITAFPSGRRLTIILNALEGKEIDVIIDETKK